VNDESGGTKEVMTVVNYKVKQRKFSKEPNEDNRNFRQ